MGIRDRFRKKEKRSMVFAVGSVFDEVCGSGYTRLTDVPEVVACAKKIAELIGSATIHLMANTSEGDERIVNELSRLVDIEPIQTMTRPTWMEAIIMTLLLMLSSNSEVELGRSSKGISSIGNWGKDSFSDMISLIARLR